MKRPRKFLSFILFLLLINSLFFFAWYALDLQGTVKGIVEREAGKALGGKLRIADFIISDRQVYAQGISFKAADNSLSFEVDNARVRFNLLRFIVSGFKIRNILNHVEINKADVAFNLLPDKEPKKPGKRFELPDLTPFFNDLKVKESSFRFRGEIPLALTEEGMLVLSDSLGAIDIEARNSKVTRISLSARSSSKGLISATAVLDKGRLVSSHAEISNFIPQYIDHPQIKGAGTELNLVLDASQPAKNARIEVSGKAILWNTHATLLDDYPVRIPYLTAEIDGDRLSADISPSSVGSSSLGGSLSLTGLGGKMSIQPSELTLQLDLGMLDPGLVGRVDAQLFAEGPLKSPSLSLQASSPSISYQGQEARAVTLEANYSEEELSFSLQDAIWNGLAVSLAGAMDTKYRRLLATLDVSPVAGANPPLSIDGSAELELALYDKLPEVKATFGGIDFRGQGMSFDGIIGQLLLVPASSGQQQNYYVDLDLKAADGTQISAVGDLLDRNLLLDANLNALEVAGIYPHPLLSQLAPLVGGQLSAFMQGDEIVASSSLTLGTRGQIELDSGLDLIGSYNLKSRQGFASLKTESGSFNGQPLDLDLVCELDNTALKVHSLDLNQQLLLSGDLDLNDLRDFAFDLSLKDLSSSQISDYYPILDLPEFSGLGLSVSYNQQRGEELQAEVMLGELKLPGVQPLQARLSLQGQPEHIEIAGTVNNPLRQLIALQGTANLIDQGSLNLKATLDKLGFGDLLESAPAEGAISGELGLAVDSFISAEREISFTADLNSPRISIPDMLDLEDLDVRLAQFPELLRVDTLFVRAADLAKVECSGALDYNFLTQNFFEGGNSLELKVQGYLFDWLDRSLDIITSARGESDLQCTVQTLEDQFLIKSGNLSLRRASISIKDQPEPIRDLNFELSFDNNRVNIDSAHAFMGKGKLTILNEFGEDSSSHFSVGFLDLGSLKLKIDEPGIIANIPLFTVPRTSSNIVLRGQNSEYATVRGPFEDMAISAEVLVYNADAVYPPNTDNLLNLIYSFSGALSKPQEQTEELPLPFTMDLMIRLKDNIKYTTYPTELYIEPDAHLHIIYDGKEWHAAEAYFLAQRGSIDFFGTVFQAEELTINILESQDLIDIEGSFYRRAEDGTIITLAVSTDSDTSKPIFDRLKFSLQSDNPDDRTISNIFARLRYSASGNEEEQQDGNALKDEALNLISDNLNSSLVAPFLLPVENSLRRWLRLDSVSINAGFIQNLFNEYSTVSGQTGGFDNMNQLMGDVARFSSSILLNNLNVSISKYLGRKLYLDYMVTLQEATDMQSQTKITVTHDTSLRLFLPEKFRLTYTFRFEHEDKAITHEIMLFRSFRFWGL